MINSDQKNLIFKVLLTALTTASIINCLGRSLRAEVVAQSYQVLVNSDRDTPIKPDRELTFREAINLVNNTLSLSELSSTERQQVKVIPTPNASRIEFDLPAPVKIELQDLLPPLVSTGLVIDGTTHADYDPNDIATVEIPIPIPVVTLTAADKNVFRGLTISGDRIKIQGLSIYGFSQPDSATNTTPGADIVISSSLFMAPAIATKLGIDPEKPPRDVEIVDNWLGIPPDESMGNIPSGFGVWLFDGKNTKITRNRIYHHGGSGILTSVTAKSTQIKENIIVGNGLTGMPHGIYLEGAIKDSLITDNLICGNDGSSIYLFKPEGNITINNNTIKFNGRRVPSAAIYLIGNDHQVTNNQISWQKGTGVTVAAYPKSDRNLINQNSFSYLEGLSIDLNTRVRVHNPFFKLGDGVNPVRNSGNRRRDTANRAINAPQFLSQKFYLIDGTVHIDGIADPGSKVTLYQVDSGLPRKLVEQIPLARASQDYGPLTIPLTDVVTDEDGRFGFSSDNLAPGTVISAIATQINDGTSEPASNAIIQSLPPTTNPERSPVAPIAPPNCTTKPIAEVSNPPAKLENTEVPPKRRTASLNVPREIHFALDRATIAPKSAAILDRIAALLIEYPFLTIELYGHTDSRANVQYNLELSRRRANASRNYLLKQGVSPARMTIRSLGESQLEKTGDSIVDHAHNRRVEIVFRDLRNLDLIFIDQDEDLYLEK